MYVVLSSLPARTVPQPPQGGLGHGSALEPSTDQEHAQKLADSELDPTLALAIVCHGFVICTPRSLLTRIYLTQPMSVSSLGKYPESPS